MKKFAFLIGLITLFGFSHKTFAQDEGVPKELLLTTLNSVAHLKFENEQVSKLMSYNEGFVDEIYEILDSDKEEKQKKK